MCVTFALCWLFRLHIKEQSTHNATQLLTRSLSRSNALAMYSTTGLNHLVLAQRLLQHNGTARLNSSYHSTTAESRTQHYTTEELAVGVVSRVNVGAKESSDGIGEYVKGAPLVSSHAQRNAVSNTAATLHGGETQEMRKRNAALATPSMHFGAAMDVLGEPYCYTISCFCR